MKNELLSIGEIAKLKSIGIKALRYYEKIGLLLPAYVDENSGYRYYDLNQTAVIDIIISCVELGIPLKDVIEFRGKDGALDMTSLLKFGKERADERLERLMKRQRQIESYITGMNERSVLSREIVGSKFLVEPLSSSTFNIKEYIKKITHLFEKADELALTSLYLEGIIFDPRRGELLCAVEVDDFGLHNGDDELCATAEKCVPYCENANLHNGDDECLTSASLAGSGNLDAANELDLHVSNGDDELCATAEKCSSYCENTNLHNGDDEFFVYPEGEFKRSIIKESSLEECFGKFISRTKRLNETDAPASAFVVWQERHKREVSVLDAIFPGHL